jgi:hypothetical protein
VKCTCRFNEKNDFVVCRDDCEMHGARTWQVWKLEHETSEEYALVELGKPVVHDISRMPKAVQLMMTFHNVNYEKASRQMRETLWS